MKYKKSSSKDKVPMEKLTDANYAGTKKSKECMLVLTEGDSAKTSAVELFSRYDGGSNKYGFMPLRGKLLNPQNCTAKKLSENTEFRIIEQALGLERYADYNDQKYIKKLRYGSIIIFTDQDYDGFHIQGLILNFMIIMYESLWKSGNFNIYVESTPIVRVYIGNKKKSLNFYCDEDYFDWIKENENVKHHAEYNKGLAGLETDQLTEIAKNRKTIEFILDKKSKKFVQLVFNKNFADKRKEWLSTKNKDYRFVYEGKQDVSNFLDNGVKLFSLENIKRAIPSAIDGFKESQRKVIHTLLDKNITGKVNVAKTAGIISSHTLYHHGEKSLTDTIINMAKDHTNNIQLIIGNGMFGSRMTKDDEGSARYLNMTMNPLTRLIFNKKDDPILDYILYDNQKIEPKFYVPIISTLLGNGAMGIATGYSTCIPMYHPIDIANWTKNWILGNKNTKKLIPWFNFFKGKIEIEEYSDCDVMISRGILKRYKKSSKNIWIISEIPVYSYVSDVAKELKILEDNKKIKILERNSSISKIEFIFKVVDEDFVPNIDTTMTFLKDRKKLSNFTALDKDGIPKKFKNAEHILKYFCKYRLKIYVDRKNNRIKELNDLLKKLRNKLKFVKYTIDNKLECLYDNDEEVDTTLSMLGFDKIEDGYDYLLRMSYSSSTLKKVKELEKEIMKMQDELDELYNSTEKDLWIKDIDEFLYKLQNQK